MGTIKIPSEAVDKFKNNFDQILETGNLAEGEWNKSLSKFVCEYTSSKFATNFCSNGAGLLAILLLLKEYRGYNDIFIQSNTMYGVKAISISSGLNYLGAIDCNLKTLMPNKKEVEKFIKNIKEPEKSVFLLSHIGGIINPDIKEIADLCKIYKIALVEDCAHSLGATLQGKHSGLYGDAGVYSLYATKAITAGEGGVAITNDEDLAEKLRRFVIYDRFDQQQPIAVNFRISEMQALFSLCVCEQIENIINNKILIAKRYKKVCIQKEIKYIDQCVNGHRGNYYKFIILGNSSNSLNLSKIKHKTSGVYDYSLGNDPENISNKHVCLPIWYNLEDHIISEVEQNILSL